MPDIGEVLFHQVLKGNATNDFSVELRDLIDKWRDHPGIALEELVDALEEAAADLVEEVNARAA